MCQLEPTIFARGMEILRRWYFVFPSSFLLISQFLLAYYMSCTTAHRPIGDKHEGNKNKHHSIKARVKWFYSSFVLAQFSYSLLSRKTLSIKSKYTWCALMVYISFRRESDEKKERFRVCRHHYFSLQRSISTTLLYSNNSTGKAQHILAQTHRVRVYFMFEQFMPTMKSFSTKTI